MGSLNSGRFLDNGNTRAALNQMGMLNMPAVNAAIDPESAMKGGTGLKFINTSEMLKGFDREHPSLDFLQKLYEKERSQLGAQGFKGNDLETRVQGAIDRLMPRSNAGQLASALFSTTGLEQTKKDQENLSHMATTMADLAERSMNLQVAIQAVGASFDEMSSSFLNASGLAHGAKKALIGIARVMHDIAAFANDHPALSRFVGDIGTLIAELAVLRLAIAALARIPALASLLLMKGAPAAAGAGLGTAEAAAAGAGVGLAARSAASGAGGLLEGAIAIGALATKIPGMLKGVASRGLMAFIVTGIAQSVVRFYVC